MISFQITDYTAMVAFWLGFARLLSINFQLPIYDSMPVPSIVKILTTLLFTYGLFPHFQQSVVADINAVGTENFWGLTIFYTLVGLLIGYFVKAIMNVFIASGSIITQQIGFGAVRYFDHSSGEQVGPFEKMIHWTVLIVIVSSGALIPMFKGALLSFHSINLSDFSKIANAPLFCLEQFKSIFSSSLMLASPIIFTNMLVNTILGIIARTVPQMNIIMVSFIINIGLGLLVFMATSEEFFYVAYKMYTQKLGEWFQYII